MEFPDNVAEENSSDSYVSAEATDVSLEANSECSDRLISIGADEEIPDLETLRKMCRGSAL